MREGEKREEERRKVKMDIDRVLRDIREGERREEERRKEKIDIDQGKYNFLDIDSDSSDSDETTRATSPKPRPILKVFLEGLYDKESNLSKLKVRGCEHAIRIIWKEIRDFYQSVVTKPQPRCCNSYFVDLKRISFPPEFPPPSGININMMPFISSENFEKCRLPAYLNPYRGLIMYCLGHEKERNPSSTGKVFYLSIEESEVEVGFLLRKYFKEPNFYYSFHLTQVEDGVPESKLLIVHLRGRLASAEVTVSVLGDLQVDLVLVKNSEIC